MFVPFSDEEICHLSLDLTYEDWLNRELKKTKYSDYIAIINSASILTKKQLIPNNKIHRLISFVKDDNKYDYNTATAGLIFRELEKNNNLTKRYLRMQHLAVVLFDPLYSFDVEKYPQEYSEEIMKTELFSFHFVLLSLLFIVIVLIIVFNTQF